MKAWKDIEKRYKILFYFAIIVIYFLFLDNFYDLGSKFIPVKPGFAMKYVTPGIGDYLGTLTGYFSWFLIAVLGYFSRSKFDGMMIGLTFWAPWLIWFIFSTNAPLYDCFGACTGWIGLIIIVFFTILAAIFGIVFGFIGSKRRKDTSGGNSEVLNEHRSTNEEEAGV